MLPFILLPCITVNSLALSSWGPLYGYWKAAVPSFSSWLFFRLNKTYSPSLLIGPVLQPPEYPYGPLLSLLMSFLNWEPQYWTGYSRCSLKCSKCEGIITSLDLLVLCLLIQPRVLLAFFAARTPCQHMLCLLFTWSPRSFLAEMLPSQSVRSLFCCCKVLFLL